MDGQGQGLASVNAQSREDGGKFKFWITNNMMGQTRLWVGLPKQQELTVQQQTPTLTHGDLPLVCSPGLSSEKLLSISGLDQHTVGTSSSILSGLSCTAHQG